MKYGELRQALEEHGVDVAIGMNVDSSISSDYRSTPIYRYHFVIACNRANPLASMASGITVDDLRDQRLLIPDSYMSSGLAEAFGRSWTTRPLPRPKSSTWTWTCST